MVRKYSKRRTDPSAQSIEQRFWAKVKQGDPGECWEWTAGKLKAGYGRLLIQGKTQNAHRVSWNLANGKIPNGLSVLHKCDNPSCVNPNHLFLGTQADNISDMIEKGRRADFRGSNNSQAKLTRDQVEVIRKESAKPGVTQRFLAEVFSVSNQQISRIISRKQWTWTA